MSLAARRVLYIFFMLAFFITTPLVMLYAAGYKLTLNSSHPFQIQKTGMLILNTKPEGAKVYLNGEPQQFFINKFFSKNENFIATPAKIKNLLPGEYDVRISLPGYWDWQKKLTVKAGESTYAEDVYLFRNNLPIPLLIEEIRESTISPNRKFLAVKTADSVKIINLDNEEVISFDNKADNAPILWSPDGKKIIIGNYLYGANGEMTDLEHITENSAVDFRWDYKNNKVNYLIRENGLISIKNYDFFTLSSKTLFTSKPEDEIADYFVKNNDIYILNRKKDMTKLNIYNQKNLIASIELINSSDYSFASADNGYLNLTNNSLQKIYLISPEPNFQIEEIIDANKISWINGSQYITATDFEIWLNDIRTKDKFLLTRISSPIKEIIWHPSNNYIIFTTDSYISTIELDNREKRNITELIKLEHISDTTYNKNGDALYFRTRIGNQEGLYKLVIN
ncbi:MAG: PEGA domain-containing protein [Patescibacteria group bacterium]